MEIKIKDVVNVLTSPAEQVSPTVDVLEPGDPDATVRGIAVTFLATQEIIEKAEKLGVNLIISHEGIYFSHWDKRDMLKKDPVFLEKNEALKKSGIAVFRFHDNIHHYAKDGVTKGLLQTLGWLGFEVVNLPAASVLEIPEMSLQDVIIHIKSCLNIPYVRYIGDTAKACRRVGVLVGYRGGGDTVLPLIGSYDPDVVIYGEGPEWEAPEYFRDAVRQGRNKALVVLGHAESEAPGMERFTAELGLKFPGLPVHFIKSSPVFRLL